VSCRYHLLLDVKPNGAIRYASGTRDPIELEHSCALDLADERGHTLEELGKVMDVTRERIRQIEYKLLQRLKRAPTLSDNNKKTATHMEVNEWLRLTRRCR
jgi:hypothetical protein